CGNSRRIKSIRVVAYSRHGSYCAAHRRVNARRPASRGNATASSPSQLRTLKAEFPKVLLMRSIPVIDESSIAIARSYEGIADWLLLDSYESGDRQIGALGVTHSWELDRRIIESVHIPAIIAGGLGPENV